MKPAQTAKSLVDKFDGSKKYALLCVYEIRNSLNNSAHGAAWELEILMKKEEFWEKVETIIKHMI
jgi:hypothetical protein